jgi:hypothetical protein
MKMRRTLCLSIALAISRHALANLPMPEDSLGKIEGILDFCIQADTQASAKYQERKRQIASEATEQELADARNTQAYKASYAEIGEQLSKASKGAVQKACSAYLTGK